MSAHALQVGRFSIYNVCATDFPTTNVRGLMCWMSDISLAPKTTPSAAIVYMSAGEAEAIVHSVISTAGMSPHYNWSMWLHNASAAKYIQLRFGTNGAALSGRTEWQGNFGHGSSSLASILAGAP
eukprot:5097554-Amphidinium_carterae.1